MMFFYHGYALGVAGTSPGQPSQEFTEASCALSVRGGSASASKSGAPLPPGISFQSADSKITGWNIPRQGQPVWVTEGTVAIQKLNVQDKFTADLIQAHIYGEWRAGDYEADIVVTGSKFENVKIAGSPVTIGTSDSLSVRYSTTSNMEKDFENSFSRDKVLSNLVGRDLSESDATTSDLRDVFDGYQQQKAASSLEPLVLCSFVTKVSNGGGGIKTWGPIVAVPNFGNIYLGEVMVWNWMRCVNMFRIELASGGTISGGSTGYGGAMMPP